MFEGTMNVGLTVDATGELLTVADVVDAAVTAGVILGKPTVVNSDSEPTAVVTFASPTQKEVWQMAKMLQQDCIACYDARNWRGFLIGPNHAAWGEFDPAMFFTSTGKRLADLIEGLQA
jgi:hypothetical protein